MENPFETLEKRLETIEEKLDRLIQNIENPEDTSPIWISTKQLSKHIGMSTTAINNFRGRKLPYYKIGGRIFFKKQEVDEWIETTRHMTGQEHLNQWLKTNR